VTVDLDGLAGASSRCPAPRRTTRTSQTAATRCISARLGRQPGRVLRLRSRHKKETAPGHRRQLRDFRDGKKMLVRRTASTASSTCRTGGLDRRAAEPRGLEVSLDRRAEWKQMFHECWRQMRDFFIRPGPARRRLGAVRKEVRSRCSNTSRTGGPHVHHREMISELNVGPPTSAGRAARGAEGPAGLCSARSSTGWRDRVLPVTGFCG